MQKGRLIDMKKRITFALVFLFALPLAACDGNHKDRALTGVNHITDSTNGSKNSLAGTWYCIVTGVHDVTEYYWTFDEDGRFAYYASGLEPPQDGADISGSRTEHFMQGRFRENGKNIECYDIQADSCFEFSDNWKYFPGRNPAYMTGILLTTPLQQPENVDDFSLEFEFKDSLILHLASNNSQAFEQYDMDFENTEIIINFMEQIEPFSWYDDYEKGEAAVTLYVSEKYKKELFRKRRKDGFFGNGYDWDALAQAFIQEVVPDLQPKIEFDSEHGMFCVYSSDSNALKQFIIEFKKACENDKLINDIFSRAIPPEPVTFEDMKKIFDEIMKL